LHCHDTCWAYCCLIPAVATASVHSFRSAATSSANSAGVMHDGSAPSAASRSMNFGPASSAGHARGICGLGPERDPALGQGDPRREYCDAVTLKPNRFQRVELRSTSKDPGRRVAGATLRTRL
jgi:hypothetical protein